MFPNMEAVMRGLRVFLVENHEDSVKYMRLYLEHLGHKVTTAENMATALKLFPGSTWDVLISDIALPDGDGWELMERIKSARPGLSISMSGYGRAEDLLRSRSAGYDHHLVKPFTPGDLVALLEKAGAVVENQKSDREQDHSKENLPEWIK
jgi:two-component system CheB/CheR fusion protein